MKWVYSHVHLHCLCVCCCFNATSHKHGQSAFSRSRYALLSPRSRPKQLWSLSGLHGETFHLQLMTTEGRIKGIPATSSRTHEYSGPDVDQKGNQRSRPCMLLRVPTNQISLYCTYLQTTPWAISHPIPRLLRLPVGNQQPPYKARIQSLQPHPSRSLRFEMPRKPVRDHAESSEHDAFCYKTWIRTTTL